MTKAELVRRIVLIENGKRMREGRPLKTVTDVRSWTKPELQTWFNRLVADAVNAAANPNPEGRRLIDVLA